jgi:hypothetical protein
MMCGTRGFAPPGENLIRDCLWYGNDSHPRVNSVFRLTRSWEHRYDVVGNAERLDAPDSQILTSPL